jgi:hypothetical protein
MLMLAPAKKSLFIQEVGKGVIYIKTLIMSYAKKAYSLSSCEVN